MTLGVLYVGIETTCRSIRDKAAGFQQMNISLLTDAQKAKLNMLSDAMRLVPSISDAQLENLLGSAVSAPDSFSTDWFSGAYYNGFRLRGVSGCAPAYGNFLSPTPLSVGPTRTSQPVVAEANGVAAQNTGLSNSFYGRIPKPVIRQQPDR